jgi:hypothetical protein
VPVHQGFKELASAIWPFPAQANGHRLIIDSCEVGHPSHQAKEYDLCHQKRDHKEANDRANMSDALYFFSPGPDAWTPYASAHPTAYIERRSDAGYPILGSSHILKPESDMKWPT